MKSNNYDVQAFFGLLFVAFLIGILVGGYFVKRNAETVKSEESVCSCVCCGGADNG